MKQSNIRTTLTSILLFWFGLAINPTLGQDQSLLWKLEGKDIQPSYLFGTIHLLPQSQFQLSEKVKSAFDETAQLALELDMDDPGMQKEMMSQISMKDGLTLDSLLDTETYEKLDQLLMAQYNVGLEVFNTWKPYMVSSMLYAYLLDEPLASFEISFIQMAVAAKKETYGIESVKEQMDIFDQIPYEKQAEDLKEMVLNTDEQSKELKELIELYLQGNIQAIDKATLEHLDDPSEYQTMISDRNKKWIGRIASLCKEKSTFIAVGAGHLGGKTGVVQLLKDAGYTLTPIEL